MTSRPTIAIVGGGIGGLCLAIGLSKHSHLLHVAVYEAAPAFTEIGAGVAFGPNAQRALRLISPAAEQAFHAQRTPNLTPGFERTWFDFHCGVQGPRYGEQLGKVENQTGQQTAHRARFLDELARLVPPEIAHYGKRLVEIVEGSNGGDGDGTGDEGRVVLRFADGTTAMADCVIGADGVHSIVRKYLLRSPEHQHLAKPAFSGSQAYRGIVPMDVAREKLGLVANDSHSWVGDGGVVINYPIDFGRLLNVVAVRIGKERWEYDTSVVKASREEARREFAHWGEVPQKMIDLLTEPWLYAVLHHHPAPFYYTGRVAMMGDSAHAMTPSEGQGAAQAIEDALVLTTLLGRVKTAADIEPVLAAYDAVRRPRSQRVVETSQECMVVFSFRDGVVNGDRDKWRELWRERMNWIWDVDLEAQNREALMVLDKLRAVNGR
ncbi:hypothetical protein GE09DRAFT_990382 [Coniochaeta sp. 2T2.1]|nr:hypothetical protein GE09DRAFT_990382 [Coniochaeta sp. 2T2.1]